MGEKLESEFKIVRNPPEKYWTEIIQKLVDDVQWLYSFADYEINRKSFDYSLYCAIEKDSDKVVGIISLAKAALLNQARPRHLSIIGTFYILPDYRRRGIGVWLFQTMLNDATDDKFLISTTELWEKYRDRFGFDKIADCRNNFVSGLWSDLRIGNLKLDESLQIVDWKAVDYKKICVYDSGISQCDRSAYLANTFGQPKSIAKLAIDEKGEILGICRVRLLINENVGVAPLYANDTIIASSLLRSCLECLIDGYGGELSARSRIGYKIPSSNAAALELLRSSMRKLDVMASGIIQYTKEVVEV